MLARKHGMQYVGSLRTLAARGCTPDASCHTVRHSRSIGCWSCGGRTTLLERAKQGQPLKPAETARARGARPDEEGARRIGLLRPALHRMTVVEHWGGG